MLVSRAEIMNRDSLGHQRADQWMCKCARMVSLIGNGNWGIEDDQIPSESEPQTMPTRDSRSLPLQLLQHHMRNPSLGAWGVCPHDWGLIEFDGRASPGAELVAYFHPTRGTHQVHKY